MMSLTVISSTPFARPARGLWKQSTQWVLPASNAQGNPHISHTDGAGGNLRYAVKTGGSWTLEVADTTVVAAFTSIALDSQGDAHISYHDHVSGTLRLAHRTGGVWAVEGVDDSGHLGDHSSIAFDAADNPHISFFDTTNDLTKYAVKIAGEWSIETVESTGTGGLFTSLALDGQGNPHVSYFDGDSGQLRYAVRTGNVWVPQLVDPEGGTYTSITLDADGNPMISYYLLNSVLRVADASPQPTGIGLNRPPVHDALRFRGPLPNPLTTASGRAAFSFFLPRSDAVTMEVYDVTGRRMALRPEETLREGHHDMTWALPALPSGVYFARLQTRGGLRSQVKFAVIK
jgi:hypothetical protein